MPATVTAHRKTLFALLLALSLALSACSSGAAAPATQPPPSAAELAITALPGSTPAPQYLIGTAGLGDSLFPYLGNGGYDVRHYELELEIDPASDQIIGQARITAIASENLQRFNIDFARLEVLQLSVNGQEADFFHYLEHELVIYPASPLPAGAEFLLEIRYQGSPTAAGTQPHNIRGAWENTGTAIYAYGEPSMAWLWYPVNAHPSDKASYRTRFTVPAPYLVISNGTPDAVEELPDGRLRYGYRMDQPMASYLTTLIVVQDYVKVRQNTASGLPLLNYCPQANSLGCYILVQNQPRMLEFFSERFGAYPFETYGSVVVDSSLGWALETQTMSTFGSENVTDPYGDHMVAHELAHSWFGNSVTISDWGDIWLNEAFATFAHGLWAEEKREFTLQAYAQFWLNSLRYPQPDKAPITPPGLPTVDNLFNDGVYMRGALTLYALQEELGEELFWELVREYYARFAGSNVRTADFIATAEEVSGRELKDFFDAWLYGAEIPPVPGLY
jgi:aminopeptidase N